MKIQITDVNGHQEVLLDGQRIYPLTTSILCRSGYLPEVSVELDIISAETLGEPDRIILPDDTVDTLKKLGWTPPVEQSTS